MFLAHARRGKDAVGEKENSLKHGKQSFGDLQFSIEISAKKVRWINVCHPRIIFIIIIIINRQIKDQLGWQYGWWWWWWWDVANCQFKLMTLKWWLYNVHGGMRLYFFSTKSGTWINKDNLFELPMQTETSWRKISNSRRSVDSVVWSKSRLTFSFLELLGGLINPHIVLAPPSLVFHTVSWLFWRTWSVVLRRHELVLMTRRFGG